MENITQIEYLFPKTVDWTTWLQQKADIPFSESVIEFLNALSQSLLHDPSSRAFSDVVTFAFFCRRANMQKQKERYTTGQVVLGKGLIFHIAPSNVPINFAYSLVAGLVAGNYNIVRVSSKTFPQVDIVIRHIASLADTYPEVAQRIILVRYDHESNANKVFSAAISHIECFTARFIRSNASLQVCLYHILNVSKVTALFSVAIDGRALII